MSKAVVARAAGAAVVLLAMTACATPSPSPTRSLPSGLPRTVPIIAGAVAAETAAAHEWKIWIASPDPGPAYRRAAAQLGKAGFDTVSTESFADNGQGQFCDATYCVNVSAYDDPTYGRSVAYDVFPLSPNAVG